MTDMRATVRLYFEIHGKTYEIEMYINYFPDDDGVDRRIKECFSVWWEDSLESIPRNSA